jgi:hypothetical protein
MKCRLLPKLRKKASEINMVTNYPGFTLRLRNQVAHSGPIAELAHQTKSMGYPLSSPK